MYDLNIIEKEISEIKLYIENIKIYNYKNCIMFNKFDIISHLYFLYVNLSDHINKILVKDSRQIIFDKVMELIEDVRFKVIVLKFTLINMEKNQKNTSETLSFKEYISKNRELLEIYLAKNLVQDSDFESILN